MIRAYKELLERAEFFRYFIVICKTDGLCDEGFPFLFNLKLQGGMWIGAVIISDELQRSAREFLKFSKWHAHGKGIGTDIPWNLRSDTREWSRIPCPWWARHRIYHIWFLCRFHHQPVYWKCCSHRKPQKAIWWQWQFWHSNWPLYVKKSISRISFRASTVYRRDSLRFTR